MVLPTAVVAWDTDKVANFVHVPGLGPLQAPLREADVRDLSAGVSWVLGSGCTFQQVSIHRREIIKVWPNPFHRKPLQRLLEIKHAMDEHYTRQLAEHFFEVLTAGRPGLGKRELLSMGWARDIYGPHRTVLNMNPQPLTYQMAQLIVEAYVMLGNWRPGQGLVEIPIRNPQAVAAVRQWWPELKAIERESVRTAWTWWRGYMVPSPEWMAMHQVLFKHSNLARAIAANWAKDYRDPLAKPPSSAKVGGSSGSAFRWTPSVYRGRMPDPSPYGGVVQSQVYVPRLPDYNGGWQAGNSPVFNPFFK